jgi:hypothetical protein
VSFAAADLEVASRTLQSPVPPLHRGTAAPARLGVLFGRPFDLFGGAHRRTTLGAGADGATSGPGALTLPVESIARTTYTVVPSAGGVLSAYVECGVGTGVSFVYGPPGAVPR